MPLVERLKTMLQKVKQIGECIAIAIPPNAGQGLETNLKRCMDREFALLYTMSIMLVGHRTSSAVSYTHLSRMTLYLHYIAEMLLKLENGR